MPEYVYKLWDKNENRYVASRYWNGRYTFMTVGAAKGIRTRWKHRRDIEIHEFELVKTERVY